MVQRVRWVQKVQWGWCGAKNNEAPRSFNSASCCCHFERKREISMAERSLADVRQHQDIVFPWRIHADSRRAVEIEGCARDDDTKGWLSPRPSGIALFIRRRNRHHNPEPAPLSSKLSLFVPCILLSRLL